MREPSAAITRSAHNAGLIDNERIVQQGERLRRHIGGIAISPRHRGIREVEGFKKARALVTRDFQVNAASSVAVERALIELSIVLRFLAMRLDARRTGWVQAAGNRENGIANRFAFEAAHRIMREQPVQRVVLSAHRLRPARLLKRLRKHQKTNLLFDGPAFTNKARRKVIEQLGIRGRLAVGSEVVRSGNDAAPEHIEPDAIGHHTRGKRIWAHGQSDPRFHGVRCRRL